MPPKKSAAPTDESKPAAAATAPAHGSYIDMVKDAIINLKDRNGSSRQAIQKYIHANNKIGNLSDLQFRKTVNRAIASGEEKGDFTRPKGTSGPVKLAKKAPKPSATTKEAKSKADKKAAAPKKAATAKPKATPTKKASEKKTAAPKKAAATATKPKANASKPRKTAPAPAVEEAVSRVLGKTKSGRVTKTKAPAAEKAPAKKAAAPKKAAATKKSTPKKAAATKKATPTKKSTPKSKA